MFIKPLMTIGKSSKTRRRTPSNSKEIASLANKHLQSQPSSRVKQMHRREQLVHEERVAQLLRCAGTKMGPWETSSPGESSLEPYALRSAQSSDDTIVRKPPTKACPWGIASVELDGTSRSISEDAWS